MLTERYFLGTTRLKICLYLLQIQFCFLKKIGYFVAQDVYFGFPLIIGDIGAQRCSGKWSFFVTTQEV